MKRILDLLFWAVIAAAFIGPGTITTAARAGSDFRFALAWALVFSVIACWVLQEAAGRLTAVTGLELGEALGRRFGRWVTITAAFGIVLGCAAYEAGNLLGGVAGLRLLVGIPAPALTLAVGVAAAAILLRGDTGFIAKVLGALVAVMGVGFLVTAGRLGIDVPELLKGLAVPRIPAGSTLLVLGLIGTTVVPYNLFLGSALARDRRLGEMRWGLAVAIGGGGLISLAVLVVGTTLGGGLSFEQLAGVLNDRLGPGAGAALGLGLFAAGFTSAVTAPLAAAIAVRTLMKGEDRGMWAEGSTGYRMIWAGIVVVGVGFGVAGVRPIPMIILAQAFNGVLLPLIAVFLWITMNDRRLLGREGANGLGGNVVMGIVVLTCLVLGGRALVAAVESVIRWLG